MLNRQRRAENSNNNSNYSQFEKMTFFSEAEKELTDTEDTKGNSSLMSRRGENSDLSNLRRRERNAAIPVKRRQRIAAKDTPEKQENSSIPSRTERSHRSRQPLRNNTNGAETFASPNETDSFLPNNAFSNNSEESPMRASRKNSTKLDLFASFASPTLPSLFENDSSIDPNLYFANNNPGALSLICEQAFSDSKGFQILALDKYTYQKNRLAQIQQCYVSLQTKLSKEVKMKESLELKPEDRDTKKQNERLEAKMKDIAKELWNVVGDLISAERIIMKHICGAVVLKYEDYMKNISNAPTLKIDRNAQDAKRKLAIAEEKVQTLDAQVSKLNAKIERLEMNGETPLPSIMDDGVAEKELILPRTPRRTPPRRNDRARATRTTVRKDVRKDVRKESTSSDDNSELREQLESAKLELKNLEELYKIQIESMTTSNQKEKEKSLETARKKLKEEIESRYEEKIELLKRQQESKIQEITQKSELEMTEYKASFQKEVLESRYRLESSEQALVDTKKQFFNEREKLQEEVDILESKLALAEKEAKRTLTEVNGRNQELEQAIQRLQSIQAEMDTSFNELKVNYGKKDQELIDFKAESEIKLNSLNQSFESKIMELEKEIQDLTSIQKDYQQSEIKWKEAEENLRSELEAQNKAIATVKTKSNQEVNRAQDALFEANNQLDRVQRLLKYVNSDLNRYKALADDRDQETLELKKTIRIKEKELADGALSSSPDSSRVRRLVEQKDADLDSKRAELRVLKADLSSLQRKLEVKNREIEEAKAQMMRAANSSDDEQTQEIVRMQVMLLDLKTTRVDLLEKLDDSQHEVETLKNKLAKIKSEESL